MQFNESFLGIKIIVNNHLANFTCQIKGIKFIEPFLFNILLYQS